jgi:hypothetical protein
MDNPGGSPPPFDERAALEELERVRAQIEHSRVQRRALQDEFREWVRSFKTPAEPLRAGPAEQPPASNAAVPAEPMAAPGPDSTAEAIDMPATLDVPAQAHEAAAEDAPPLPSDAAGPPRTIARRSAIVGGGLLLMVGGVMATWMLRGDPRPSSGQVPQARPAPPAAEPPPAPSPAAVPAEARSPGSELVTIRRVWIRVLVDGERVLERELPADARVPLRAEQTIVIRTGDAGAVRLSLDGEDQGFLGREGEVVTRTFIVPAR